MKRTQDNPLANRAARYAAMMKQNGPCGLEWPYLRRKDDFDEACKHKCVRFKTHKAAHKCNCGTVHQRAEPTLREMTASMVRTG